MRLVYICQSPIPSAAANSIQVMRMCQAFARNGLTVTLVAFPAKDEWDGPVPGAHAYYGGEPEFEIVNIPKPGRPLGSLRYGLACLRVARRVRPDVVYGRSVEGCACCAFAGFTTIFESHSPVWGRGRLARLLFGAMVRSAGFARLVVITEALKRLYVASGGIDASRIVVAPNGADDPGPPSAGARLVGSRPGSLQVGYVGRLYDWKGFDLVVRAAAKMPDGDFHVVGGTPGDIEQWRQAGVPSNIVFHGFVPASEVGEYISRLDVCLLPNQPETGRWRNRQGKLRMDAGVTSPLKMFEYMAHGKAIIASELPVLREVLDPDNAVLVPHDDVEAWIAAIETFKDPSRRETMGARARSDFQERFTRDVRARRVLEGVPVPDPARESRPRG